MLNMILGTAGSGKTYYIRQKIAELVNDGETNIALLVPEQNNFESERAMLKLLGSVSTDVVEVTSFSRLAECVEQLGKVGSGFKADDGVKMLMMGRAVRKVKGFLEVYSRSCESSEFCASVLELVSELKRSKISLEDLTGASEFSQGALKSKAHDLALIIGAYEALLSERFSDPLDDLNRLCQSLETVNYFSGRSVFVDAFKGFTQQQFAVLEHIIRTAKDVYITFCADSIDDYEHSMGLFSNVKRTISAVLDCAKRHSVAVAPSVVLEENHRFAGTQLEDVERALRGLDVDGTDKDSCVTVCSCTNMYDEADYVARTIRRLVRTQGYLYRDFAVIARDIDSYHRLLTNAFERYDIACFSDRRVEADSVALMRFVLNALMSAAENYQTEFMIPYVKSVLSPLGIEQACELENYVLMWNKRGYDWEKQWKENPNGLNADFDEKQLERLEQMRCKVVEPLVKLSKALESGNVKHICGEIYKMLIAVKADKALINYAKTLELDGDGYFASINRQSWDTLIECLDNIVRAFGDESCGKAEFISLFSMLISTCDISAIPDRLDEVVIGSADRIRIGGQRVVFVIGANYAMFPSAARQGGLLSLSDRRKLKNGGLKMPDYARETAIDERFIAYTSLCSPSEKLIITYHMSSLLGETVTKSEFVNLICEKVSGIECVRSSDTELDRLEGVLPAVELVSSDEHRVMAKSLSEALQARGLSEQALVDSIMSKPAEAALESDTAMSLFGKDIKMSASKVETYSKCPFSYFCEFGLKAKPSKSAELDVLQKGTLIHYVLEKAVSGHGNGLSALTAEQRREEIAQLLREYSDSTFGGFEQLDKEFLFLVERIAIILDNVLERIGDELAQSEFSPDKFELRIGDEVDAVKVKIKDGSVTLRGAVDRVDIYKVDGKTYVRVVDYKSGSKQFDMSDIFCGINMQMLLYLFAIIDSDLYENPEYAGVLYMPSKRSVKEVDRNLSNDKIRLEQDSALSMKGLLINDSSVLNAMDNSKEGRYIPYYPQSNRKQSWVAGKEDFDNIKRKVFDIIEAMGNAIHAGEIAVDPVDTANGSACKYCDYAAVCRHNSELNRKAEKYSLALALEKLAEEAE